MTKANILYQFVTPYLKPQHIEPILGDMDVLVLAAYCSGTIPSDLHDLIQAATEAQTPVFSIRQSKDDNWRTEWSDYKEEVPPGKYATEAEAIGRGLIPLQKDMIGQIEVLEGLSELVEQSLDYETLIGRAMGRFSSEIWNRTVNGIRSNYGLEPILVLGT